MLASPEIKKSKYEMLASPEIKKSNYAMLASPEIKKSKDAMLASPDQPEYQPGKIFLQIFSLKGWDIKANVI